MPQYLVVAGPNGAGKSTFSQHFSRPGALIFDPDEQKYKIEKQYPDISHEALESEITRKYNIFELKALGSQLHLTVETNLRNDFLADRAEFFHEHGYETRLIFMLLPDLSTSMDRVNLRVKQKGHFVDADSIKTNFEKGLENLVSIAHHFDQLMILSGANTGLEKTQPQLLLTVKDWAIAQRAINVPLWCRDIVQNIEELFSSNNLTRGRGRD